MAAQNNSNVFVIQSLIEIDATLLQRAARVLGKRLEQALGVAKTQYLSGPRPDKLDVVTTRLRNSLERKEEVHSDKVTASIGTNIPYAGFHEFGFIGDIAVQAHIRHTEKYWGDEDQVRRKKAIRDRAGNIIGYKQESIDSAKKRGVEFDEQKVKAHTRKVNYKGRPFLRPALLAVQPLILSDLKELFNPPSSPEVTNG